MNAKMRMRRGEVARAETQRSGGGELDVNGYELFGKREMNIEHRTSKGRGMLDFEF
jgi:hypothetical protein